MGHIEYQKATTSALSDSIVKVAHDELARLSSGLDTGKVTEVIENALDELRGLQLGRIPDYEDEWVALFYITWFQQSQINLAYSMIKAMARLRDPVNADLTDTRKLRVIDFGCGALAMQFAVALAVAYSLQPVQHGMSIEVDSMDDSQAMRRAGQKIWRQFKREVKENAELATLSRVCEDMKCRTGRTYSARKPGEEIWLSAIHVVYESNKCQVEEQLAQIADRVHPDVGLLTTHDSLEGRELIKAVSPFPRATFVDINPEFDGELTEITKWRQDLGQHHSYLRGRVTWEWRPASTLMYTKP